MATSERSREDSAPDVVVSIVHASNADLTLDCLESLREDRARRCSARTVVLDNASGDEIATHIRERFPGVEVVEQEFRRGFGANHNTVIRATRSRYVFVLNNDTRVARGALDTLVAYMDEHPEVAATGPLIRDFDGRQQGSAWRLMTIPVQLAWALTLGQRGAVVSRGTRPKRVGAVSACAMLIRRDAFARVGLFDESYFMFSEEADMARKFNRLGLQSHYVPAVEVFHLGQASTSRALERHVNEVWRSLDRYLDAYHSPFEARVIRWLTGLGYALAAVTAGATHRLPTRAQPRAAASWNEQYYRLHVRNAFRGNRDPGLRELAEEWNGALHADRQTRESQTGA
jgi:GT2 family glycosyltransferase